MKKKYQKRYIILGMVMVAVIALLWKIGPSFAFMDQGYHGNNVISGDKWGVNITEISNIEKTGDAVLIGEISTIGTTLNFNTTLFHPGDKISFDITISNTSLLKAELYALTLTGLSNIDSEYITYTILPIDSSLLHTDTQSGSIIKSGEKQMFNITVKYDTNAKVDKEVNLGLGSTVIYKQV